MTQSTGHPCVLHVSVWDSAGQAAPPFAAGVVTVLVRPVVPPPHGAVQAVQDVHGETAQSTGHPCVLQASC